MFTGSNYPTALNHRFREESGYDVAAQVKRKCTYCGVWAEKGKPCQLCRTFVPGPTSRRTNSPAASSRSASASTTTSSQQPLHCHPYAPHDVEVPTVFPPSLPPQPSRMPLASYCGNTTPTVKSRCDAALRSFSSSQLVGSQHKLTKAIMTPHTPGKSVALKVRCNFCGEWVMKGRYCALCRTLNQ